MNTFRKSPDTPNNFSLDLAKLTPGIVALCENPKNKELLSRMLSGLPNLAHECSIRTTTTTTRSALSSLHPNNTLA